MPDARRTEPAETPEPADAPELRSTPADTAPRTGPRGGPAREPPDGAIPAGRRRERPARVRDRYDVDLLLLAVARDGVASGREFIALVRERSGGAVELTESRVHHELHRLRNNRLIADTRARPAGPLRPHRQRRAHPRLPHPVVAGLRERHESRPRERAADRSSVEPDDDPSAMHLRFNTEAGRADRPSSRAATGARAVNDV